MNYPVANIRFKYYGKNIELLFKEIAKEKDASRKKDLVVHTARLMRILYHEWNKDNIDAPTLIKHVELLSEGQLVLSEADISTYGILEATRPKDRRKSTHQTSSNNNRRRGREQRDTRSSSNGTRTSGHRPTNKR